MGALALKYARLKCSFHDDVPIKKQAGWKGSASPRKKVLYSIEMYELIQSY